MYCILRLSAPLNLRYFLLTLLETHKFAVFRRFRPASATSVVYQDIDDIKRPTSLTVALLRAP